MIIAFNFKKYDHYSTFYDFLIDHGYKDESIKYGPNLRINTQDRKILGYNINTYHIGMNTSSFNLDKVLNLSIDHIAFNFNDQIQCNVFFNLLKNIGIINTYLHNENKKSIRINDNKIIGSMLHHTYDEGDYDDCFIVDLNLSQKSSQKVNKMNEVKIPTKEQILNAASKCPQAESTLKELFPDIFPKDLSVKVTVPISDNIWIRRSGKFTDKGYSLNENYNWTIEKFHPTYAVDNSKFIITAKRAEEACKEIRKEIKTVDPIGQFQIAYVKMDLPTICRILNETWYGAPESRQVFNVPGFNILCDILSDFDYES